LLTLRGGWNVSGSLNNQYQRFDAANYAGYATVTNGGSDTTAFVLPHGLYGLWQGSVTITTPNRAVTASFDVGAGQVPVFAEAGRGRGWSATATATWRPTASIRIEARWTHLQIDRTRDGSRFSTASIPRIKGEYQLSRDVFFRWVGQYTAEERTALQDPRTGEPLALTPGAADRVGPAGRVATNEFRNDLLFSYHPTPGTVLFVGYGALLSEPEGFRFSGLARVADGFFFKASYRFRI
jgi:hypothetical protein